MSGEFQKELFDQFRKEKGRLERIADRMRDRRRRPHLYIPVENIVFAAIIFIMSLVLAFALGVERGRRRAPVAREAGPGGAESVVMQPIVVTPAKSEKPDTKPVEKRELPYTVQLVSYRQRKQAESERDRLASGNVDAFIVTSGRWFQVCAGRYENVKEADAAREKFRKEYRGCFVKKITSEKGER